jgi:hypothetical protein
MLSPSFGFLDILTIDLATMSASIGLYLEGIKDAK